MMSNFNVNLYSLTWTTEEVITKAKLANVNHQANREHNYGILKS